MPTYTYTGAYERVFTGLSVDVNASVTPTKGHAPLVPGQTVVLNTGDTLTTDQPYPHPELAEQTPPAPKTPATQPDATVQPGNPS